MGYRWDLLKVCSLQATNDVKQTSSMTGKNVIGRHEAIRTKNNLLINFFSGGTGIFAKNFQL